MRMMGMRMIDHEDDDEDEDDGDYGDDYNA